VSFFLNFCVIYPALLTMVVSHKTISARGQTGELIMWIVLLDQSASMNDPFSGSLKFRGRKRIAKDDRKIVAAKRALREYVEGLPSSELLSVIAFNDDADEVFAGTCQESACIERTLYGIEPNGNTDIPNALFEATRVAERRGESQPIVSILLISDGLSTNPDIDPAVDELSRLRLRVDVILIDPTEEGDRVARAIARHGSVSAVESPEALGNAVAASGNKHATLAKQSDEILNAANAD
jgi:Mg-chelatase subunit ChlD